ncbi:tudor domain-containing protein 7-like isoform X2 [Linepithema humile]|uniref:tudor domain-containing protein 7-like isoform X3 n=1 Tax=Linepithema humile TaxID=83485 RepID=UPI00351E3D19
MYDDKLVARFRELVSDTDLLLTKVIRIASGGIPVVEIFKRVGPNNILASINQAVNLDSQLLKVNEDSNNNIKTKKRVERKNSRALEPVGKLNPPTISNIGQYFDVHITLAAHSGHFNVQPLNDANELKAMMEDLQKCYITYDGLPLETVSKGMLYAGIFNNDWYRVYTLPILSAIMKCLCTSVTSVM